MIVTFVSFYLDSIFIFILVFLLVSVTRTTDWCRSTILESGHFLFDAWIKITSIAVNEWLYMLWNCLNRSLVITKSSLRAEIAGTCFTNPINMHSPFMQITNMFIKLTDSAKIVSHTLIEEFTIGIEFRMNQYCIW